MHMVIDITSVIPLISICFIDTFKMKNELNIRYRQHFKLISNHQKNAEH